MSSDSLSLVISFRWKDHNINQEEGSTWNNPLFERFDKDSQPSHPRPQSMQGVSISHESSNHKVPDSIPSNPLNYLAMSGSLEEWILSSPIVENSIPNDSGIENLNKSDIFDWDSSDESETGGCTPFSVHMNRPESTMKNCPKATATFSGDTYQSIRTQDFGTINNDIAPRDHPLYRKVTTGPDGLYHCPWEGKDPSCKHKPEKLKSIYDKFIDSHLKPYRCKVIACESARFSSTACLLRHEREAHAMHGHGENPFLCTYEGCERGLPGNGFPRHWNLCDHIKRVHNTSPLPSASAENSQSMASRSK